MARKCSVERATQKLGGFAVAKKKIVVEYQNKSCSNEEILEKIKADIANQGIDADSVEKLEVYIKPEESAVYYVANFNIQGKVDF